MEHIETAATHDDARGSRPALLARMQGGLRRSQARRGQEVGHQAYIKRASGWSGFRTSPRAAAAGWLLPGVIGYVLKWTDRYRRADGVTESIDPHAFDESLRVAPAITCRINHQGHRLVGKTTDGSLQLRTDPTGLRLELTPYDTADGRLLIALGQRAQLRGGSIAFDPRRAHVVSRHGHHTVMRAPLTEVSIIVAPSTPAYRAGWISLWTPAAQQRAVAEQIAGYDAQLSEMEAEL